GFEGYGILGAGPEWFASDLAPWGVGLRLAQRFRGGASGKQSQPVGALPGEAVPLSGVAGQVGADATDLGSEVLASVGDDRVMERLHLVVGCQRDLGKLDLGCNVQLSEPGWTSGLGFAEGALQLDEVLSIGDDLVVQRADLLTEPGDFSLDGGVGRNDCEVGSRRTQRVQLVLGPGELAGQFAGVTHDVA